jgi:predicted metal-dependent phosphoesterase TrpH
VAGEALRVIDLHTHTLESDGSFTPEALVAAAAEIHLEALAITDHDTFAGYDQGVCLARELGLDLVCGIELSTKFGGRSVHLLGYFLGSGPSEDFRRWILALQDSRHLRNRQLVERLQSQGIEITLEEVYERGRKLPGRPHFAALLLEKGYVSSLQQAFDKYLDEAASCYIARQEPTLAEGVERIAAGGGLASLAHPLRLSRDTQTLEEHAAEMCGMGLRGIEAYHSDHSASDIFLFESIAERLGLAVTGGSDFHGAMKPKVALGTGMDGRLNVPRSVLDRLRQA